MNVKLHIEKLVLNGFARGDRMAIRLAVSRELSRLFTEQGVPPNFSQDALMSRLDAGAFSLAENSKPAAIGTQVAQNIYGGMKGE